MGGDPGRVIARRDYPIGLLPASSDCSLLIPLKLYLGSGSPIWTRPHLREASVALDARARGLRWRAQ